MFGDYEDAISKKNSFLWHSLLSPLLNSGLLTPNEVVNKALLYAKNNNVPINSLEGFIRQIIGWREFICLVYKKYGTKMRNSNCLLYTSPSPRDLRKSRMPSSA